MLFCMMCGVTSVQDDVVDHIALVFGVVEAERTAQVFRALLRDADAVTCLHMHGEGIPEVDSQTALEFSELPKQFFECTLHG